MRFSLNSALLPAIIGLSSFTAVSIPALPASAYGVYLNGGEAGDPIGDLYNVTLHSGDVGRTLDPVHWFVPAGYSNKSKSPETTPIDLSANLVIEVKALTETFLTLGLTINNTTQLPSDNPNYKANILSFGFGVNPNATSVQLTQSGNVIFDNAIIQKNEEQTFPGGFKKIDICIYAANNCSGGNVNQGLRAGHSDSFDLKISGVFTNSKVTLSDFPLKFQTDNGSFQPVGVPEPMTVLGTLMALGFGAIFKKTMARKQEYSNSEV